MKEIDKTWQCEYMASSLTIGTLKNNIKRNKLYSFLTDEVTSTYV